MRIGWMITAILAMSRIAAAADVTVYLYRDSAMPVYQVESIAGSLLRKAGIAIAWRGEAPPDTPTGKWIRVDLAEGTPPSRFPGALAVAHPYAGCSKGITVFVDRVRYTARRTD